MMTKMIIAGLTAVLLATAGLVPAQQGSARVIAIAASGKTLPASVSSQAGRSPFFLLVDTKGALVGAVDNPYKDSKRRHPHARLSCRQGSQRSRCRELRVEDRRSHEGKGDASGRIQGNCEGRRAQGIGREMKLSFFGLLG